MEDVSCNLCGSEASRLRHTVRIDDSTLRFYRYARHAALAAIVQSWARERFAIFAQEGFESATVTCVTNSRGISVADLNRELGRQWATISNGYGKLKEQTFRIAHMGDTQEWEMRGLLTSIEAILGI